MTWDNLLDTALNLITFAYLGLLIRLYLRREDSPSETTRQ
jgi:hypothetical protein